MPKPGGTDARYDRQIRVREFGAKAQELLAKARVGIVGIGALGSRIAEELARAGVGYLRLIDRDWVELSNLHRQHLFTEADVNAEAPKSLAAAEHIAKINSEVEVDAQLCHLGPLEAAELLLDLDLWVDGTDNFQTRYLMNDLAVKEGKDWIYGACVGTQAMVAPFLKGRSCLRCLFPQAPAPGLVQTCDTTGVLPPAAAYVSAMQSALALRILGKPDDPPPGRLYTADVYTLETRSLALPSEASATCEACAKQNFPGLDTVGASQAQSLCGRNAVQLCAPPGCFPALEELEERLSSNFSTELLPHMLRLSIPEGRITLFKDGRAIVQGTDNPDRARALFDRYIGT